MIALVTPWCQVLLVLAMGLAFGRVLLGPTAADRVVAIDVITVLAAGLLGTLALGEREPAYLEIALVIALISFLATVALSMFVQHGEPPPEEEPDGR